MNTIWHFPGLDGGDDEGVNDNGIWIFEGNREKSIARECIQNSLDAHLDESKPVRVVFSNFEIDKSEIPSINELSDVVRRAKDYAADDERATELYEEATKCVSSKRIKVLRISDYNTTGLDGGDTRKDGGRWYRLLYSTGASQNRNGSGGSFGIGKSAPFTASMIRTVFYSTMLEDGSVAFQGKTRLSSFEDDHYKVHRGSGRYGLKNEDGSISSIRNRLLIPDVFERNERGTDIFIVGYKCTDEWRKRIIASVVESFYVAIIENKLEVIIEDEKSSPVHINSETLAEIVNKYVTDGETLLYYNAVINPSRHFQDDLPGIGKVEMYVCLGEGKKHIQGMRKTLMKIHEFTRLRKALSDDYTGVVIVRGDAGNDELRSLEPPAHDKWDPELGKGTAQDVLNRLRDWVWSNLKSIANEKKYDIEEIPELSKYLPQSIADDDRDPIFSSTGIGANNEGDSNAETANERNTTDAQESEVILDITKRMANVKKPGTTGGDKKKRGKKQGKNRGKGKQGGAGEPEGNTNYADVSDMISRTKEHFVNGKRVYEITITPTKDDSGDIRIIGIGDGQNYPLDIEHVYDGSGNELEKDGDIVKNLSFKANETKVITVELESSRRYVVGVA